MSTPQVVVVVGATGRCGRFVAQTLAEFKREGRPDAPATIRAVTRSLTSKDAHGFSTTPEIEMIEGDSCNPSTLRPAFKGASAVFVSLPQSLSSAEMITVGKGIADEVKAAGISKVVRISSLGIDKQGPLGAAHAEIERYMEELGLVCTSVRPTSFFTNFLIYDLPSVTSSSSFASPLGTAAAVNWIHPRDIGRVSAFALVSSTWDGKELNITGPPCNTVSAPAMAGMLSKLLGRTISYSECDVPPVPDFAGLWTFLRDGGYDVSTEVVREVTGADGAQLEAWLREVLPSEAAA